MIFKVMNKKRIPLLSVLAVLPVMLTACAPMTATRGNLLEESRTEQIKEGVSTRDDVFKALGSPTTVSPFNNNVWYYMGQKTEKRGIFDPDVVEEKIVVVKFDDNQIVQSIEEMNDARIDVPIDAHKTPTYGNDVTVIQQLLGNLGKFNPKDPE